MDKTHCANEGTAAGLLLLPLSLTHLQNQEDREKIPHRRPSHGLCRNKL